MVGWNHLGPDLYRAVRNMIQERGESSVDESVLFFMRQIATNLDQSLRVEAIHDGGELIIVEIARFDRAQDLMRPWLGGSLGRRMVVLQDEAVEMLDEFERARRLAGWFGNLPVVAS